jgi:hypothetical protein
MSELSDNINTAIKADIECQAAMLHAFDLPITAKQIMLLRDVLNGTFRLSLSKENGEVVLGFENTNNGNRVTMNLGDTKLDLPEWLGDEFNIVTAESLSYIDDSSRNGRLAHLDSEEMLHISCIISLDSIWVCTNAQWVFRRNHSTGETEEPELITTLPVINGGYLGGRAIIRANGRITTEAIAHADFKSASMAKTVLGRAGRSKPQGDLIVYFSDDTCAAEGYNSQGDTTLELSPIGGTRQIAAYESNIEENNIMGVKFNYPFYFRKLFSSREGLLTDRNVDIKLSTMSYGVTPHSKPHVKVVMPHMSVEFVLQTEDGIFMPENLELPPLNLAKTRERRAKTKVEPEAVEEIAAIGFDDLELTNIPEECKENVRNWFDAYMQSNTGDIDVNVSKWFTSYMMKCAREGTPITVSDRDAYREVTNLVD